MISSEQAVKLLSAPGRSFLSKLRRTPDPPARTELLYLPYYCFCITLSGPTDEPLVRVAVDGFSGDGVFFCSDDLERVAVGDAQSCDFELSQADARDIVLDQYKRLLLEHGLRNKTKTSVESISDAEAILYPFWIGYTRKGEAYDFKALDAVSGEAQGIRMRKVFLRAFRQLENR